MSRGRNLSDRDLLARNSCPEPNSGCWLWMGSVNDWGYGRLGRNRTERLAHRLSYLAFVGPIPNGAKILHGCDTPSCVNPAHLRAGTLSNNVQDCIARGRHVTQRGEDNPHAKLTRETVTAIRASALSIADLARAHNVSRRAIGFVVKGETWK